MISKTHKQLMEKLVKRKQELLSSNSGISLEKMTETELARGDELDIAESVAEKELEMSMRLRSEEELQHIDDALKKLHNGTYGVCDNCEEQIESKRLKARPYVKYCLSCQEEFERSADEKPRQKGYKFGKLL